MTPSHMREPTDSDLFNPLILRLQQALADARTVGERIALLLVHCGAIERTDSHQGFNAGSMLSNSIEHLLRTEALRKNDTVECLARGDFACILRPSPSEGVAILAAHRIQSVLRSSLTLGDKPVAADASVGIALFPDHGLDADLLLKRAKEAQQSALGERDRLSVYCETEAALAIDQAQYDSRLRLALRENALSLALQPQRDLRTGRITGAEALLRWHDDVLGTVPPSRIVAVAEAGGVMDQLTFWVVTRAVQTCAQFVKLDPEFTVSVNVSPSNLREPDLPMFIDRALRTWGVSGANIVVEITETAMLVDQNAANEALNELRSHGVRLSIDDFGTGYSSMYYLAQLPLEELKIDLMFVRDMLVAPVHAKIVRSLVELAHNLELTVVAEGVESEAVQAALQHLGCDRVQGYYIGKPAAAEDLLARLGARRVP